MSTVPRFVITRIAQAVLVVWIAYTVTFLALFILPSDPIRLMIGPENKVSDQSVAALEHEYGFDRPWLVRYGDGLWHAVRGDFGVSLRTGRSVTGSITAALPRTIELAGLALAIAVVVGAAVAWFSAYTRRRWLRQLLLAVPAISLSLPTFWLGILLLQAFSFGYRIFPARGGLVLPAVTLAVPSSALLAQVLSARLIEAMGDPYVDTARAQGATRARALNAHALRNAVMPALTMLALLIGWVMSGSVVIETVFARNGVGRLITSAVAGQDLTMMLALVTLTTSIFVVVTLVVDLLHPLIDPRVLLDRRTA
ncbi:ABC transporter permease [Kribbella sp. NPDC004875]|uniref:ABC transporter permease n=1 Tax=Kribbella sp. NPDC004875 TaxID=3364107 RepID=UPI0036C49CF8